MRHLLWRAPWVVWAIHASLLAIGFISLAVQFDTGVGTALRQAAVVWAVIEIPYLVNVRAMASRKAATGGAAAHLIAMALICTFLFVFGIVVHEFWLPLVPLVIPTLIEIAVVACAGPGSAAPEETHPAAGV